jgi:hypothetical protein
MMLIVVPPKCVNLLLGVLQGVEPVDVQAFFTEASVERLDRRIVRRFASSTEIQNDAVRVRPEVHRRADELGAIVPSGKEVITGQLLL